MAPKLDLVKFGIIIIKHEEESVKLKSLISQAVTKGIILYDDVNFLPYSLKCSRSTTGYFNLFLGFLAKLIDKINSEIMDPILWHTKNIISNENVKLHEYLWKWWAYLVQSQKRSLAQFWS